MRKMLLSFKPDVFEKILSGEKIYEHRRVFPDEPIEAYIYISRPVQDIAGILYFGNKTNLENWKDKYSYDVNAVNRIDEYLTRYKVVMEVQRFQNTTQIPLEDIRKVFPKFLIPQMYYYLDDLPLLDYLQDNLKSVGDSITHEFNDVESSKICGH